MALALDHVLIAVHSLQQAMDDYAALGFRVRRHTSDSVGTQTASVDFADGTRLQLLAWTTAAPDDIRWRHLHQRGEGIAAYGVAPPRTGAPPAVTHGNGAIGIEALAIAVTDVDAELARFQALVSAGVGRTHVGQAVSLPLAGSRLGTVQLGASSLLLLSPRAGANPMLGEHPLALRLAACGEGPYGLVLRSRQAEPWTVDLRLSHGAAIEFVPSASDAHASAPQRPAATVGG